MELLKRLRDWYVNLPPQDNPFHSCTTRCPAWHFLPEDEQRQLGFLPRRRGFELFGET